jgi:acyl carrier protein phosphodiesterase
MELLMGGFVARAPKKQKFIYSYKIFVFIRDILHKINKRQMRYITVSCQFVEMTQGFLIIYSRFWQKFARQFHANSCRQIPYTVLLFGEQSILLKQEGGIL